VEENALRATFLAPRGKGTIDGFDDVATLAEFPQGRFESIGKVPDAGLDLTCQPKTLQHLQSSDAQASIEIGTELACLRPQIEKALIGLAHHGAIDPGQTLIGDLGMEF
jgi:hypothetical protein